MCVRAGACVSVHARVGVCDLGGGGWGRLNDESICRSLSFIERPITPSPLLL